jgi:hypothetical protein
VRRPVRLLPTGYLVRVDAMARAVLSGPPGPPADPPARTAGEGDENRRAGRQGSSNAAGSASRSKQAEWPSARCFG